MDVFLDAMRKSIDHLRIVDEIMSSENHPNRQMYVSIKGNILALDKKDGVNSFSESLYVGGKKGGTKGYSRHMILADLIEYIFFGRGVYYVNNQESKKIFIELILNTINLLLIIDSLTVQPSLRKKVLRSLASGIDNSFFKDNDMKTLHRALVTYNGDIGFDTRNKALPDNVTEILKYVSGTKPNRKKLDDYYDSLLPKTGGGLWNELIVFFYLLRRTSVFIIPLLLIQRIHSKSDLLKPPDYLVIDSDKQYYGIEVGGGKEAQSSNFASRTGSKMLTTENENIPPRCPICGEWILFCKKVIEDCCEVDINPLLRIDKEVRCAHECRYYETERVIKGECPFIQYHGNVSPNTAEKSKQLIKFESPYHYHYSCIKKVNDSLALKTVKDQYDRWLKYKNTGINSLMTSYPAVKGIKNLEKLGKKDMVCYGKYPNKDLKNCNECTFRPDCEKYTDLMNIMGSKALSDDKLLSIKRLFD